MSIVHIKSFRYDKIRVVRIFNNSYPPIRIDYLDVARRILCIFYNGTPNRSDPVPRRILFRLGLRSCRETIVYNDRSTRIQMFQSIGYIPVYLIFEMQPDKYRIVFFLRIGLKNLIRSHPVGQKRKILF